MKTYYFKFSSGHIGGSGVVRAKTKNLALIKANEAILLEKGYNSSPIELQDLIEVKKDSATIISNGDY